MPGTKIGASVAAKPKRVKSKKKPYTQKQYDAVLAFFELNKGEFFEATTVDEEAGIGNLIQKMLTQHHIAFEYKVFSSI
jgi:hypothetical protein